MFGISTSLPAILELEEEQITYLKNTAQYNIKDLNSSQIEQPKETPLSSIEGDRFDSARTFSVNELAFKSPILGTKFAAKAKDAIVINKNSPLAKKAETIKKDRARNLAILKAANSINAKKKGGSTINVNTKAVDNTLDNITKEKGKAKQPTMLELPKEALVEKK